MPTPDSDDTINNSRIKFQFFTVMYWPYPVMVAYHNLVGSCQCPRVPGRFLIREFLEPSPSAFMKIVENYVLQYKNYALIFAASNISRKIKPQRFFQAQHFEEIHKYS